MSPANDGGDPVAEQGPVEPGLGHEVLPDHPAVGQDVAHVLDHRHEGDRGDEGDRRPLDVTESPRELRPADPGGLPHRGEAEVRVEHRRHQISDDRAGEDREHLEQALEEHRRHQRRHQGDDRQPPGPLRHADRHRCQGDADHRDHRAGHDRREQPLDEVGPEEGHEDRHPDVDGARRHDARPDGREREPPLDTHHDRRDEGERRPEEHRDHLLGDKVEHQRPDAGCDQRHRRVETREQRYQDRCPEHGDGVL
jgi:hypothetical protein